MALINWNTPAFEAERDLPDFTWLANHPPDFSVYDNARRIAVNKTTHCIRFESESESQVTIVIEPKEAE